MRQKDQLKQLWTKLYPTDDQTLLDAFLETLDSMPAQVNSDGGDWYKDAVVYSLYVDLFNKDFQGLTEKLDYIKGLGVNCLWLLPILDSPMRDAGFDIRNYDLIRHDLLGLPEEFSKQEQEKVFGKFLEEAHSRGIRVIFDIAVNHLSETHPWFQQALQDENSPYRDYFIWTKDTNKYGKARLLFKGMEDSNWEPAGDGWYFFHRFFSFQPDLNYRNPKVLIEMLQHFIYWQQMGVDGFRADAIPYLWKEENTDCENLPNTHLIVKFFRAALDYIKPGTLLLAEACQKPVKVVEYLGDGDECHAAYHFPLMPMFYKAIAQQKPDAIINILDTRVTPAIPDSAQWFTFLRCHDELSLELVYVSEEDRKYIHEQYCREPQWDFRVGEGISARLANLFEFDERRIGLAYSMMLSLPGTPVIYYGDEFGKENDKTFYEEMIRLTGKNDTRFLVRGKIDWTKREAQLSNPETFQSRVFARIRTMLEKRSEHAAFGRGNLEFVTTENPHILAYYRQFDTDRLLVVHNLSDQEQSVRLNTAELTATDMLTEKKIDTNALILPAYGYLWLQA